jgi:uncharacterized protein YndB with AHSA1/START domain
MQVDQNAPVIAQKEIIVTAPQEKTWTALTEIERWPEWQPEVSKARLEGNLNVGTVFKWKSRGLNFICTIQDFEPEKGWDGLANHWA